MPGTLAETVPPESLADGMNLEALPKEFGFLMIVAGIGGVLLPGPVGAPFLVLGGLIFFPKTFRKVDQGMARRFPRLHREGAKQIHRLVADIERRYPTRS